MFRKFIPKEYGFFDSFDKHAGKIVEGARLLLKMVEGLQGLSTYARDLKAVESEGDSITHETVANLHKTFITPLDRDVIHKLITQLDDILDVIEATGDRLALYEVERIEPDAVGLARTILESAEEVQRAVTGLRNLKNTDLIKRNCVSVNRLENEADALLRKAIARLFREVKDPLTVLKWKEIFEEMEQVTDRCEDVANTIEGIILEHG